MASEPKTRPTKVNPKNFLNTIKDEQKRKDCLEVIKIMQRATGEKPVMWGPSIIGFGSQKQKYASGRELDWPKAAFSPRKQELVLYVLNNPKAQKPLLKKLGKHKTGKICLYVKKLEDVDKNVLQKIIDASVRK